MVVTCSREDGFEVFYQLVFSHTHLQFGVLAVVLLLGRRNSALIVVNVGGIANGQFISSPLTCLLSQKFLE